VDENITLTWYVIALKQKKKEDNYKGGYYPLIVYADKEKAELVAKPNGCVVITVIPKLEN
jgi:hypothetical protein